MLIAGDVCGFRRRPDTNEVEEWVLGSQTMRFGGCSAAPASATRLNRIDDATPLNHRTRPLDRGLIKDSVSLLEKLIKGDGVYVRLHATPSWS